MDLLQKNLQRHGKSKNNKNIRTSTYDLYSVRGNIKGVRRLRMVRRLQRFYLTLDYHHQALLVNKSVN